MEGPEPIRARPRRVLPRSILIVRLGAIGDVVNALVLACALKEADPAVEIGWAVHELAEPLVRGHPCVDRVHLWRKGTGLAGFRAAWREVRAARYELAIDLQRIGKSAALARLSGARRVLGFDRERSKERSWILTNERIAPREGVAHMVEQYLEFARHLGVAAAWARFLLPRDPLAEAWAEGLVSELGGAPLLFNVGASKPANRWPPERFGALALRCLEARKGPIVLTGGPADAAAGAAALAPVKGSPRVQDLVGRTSLLHLAALCRRSRAMVACDTGPMHLAAACGLRVVALFGAADPRRTGPYGEGHALVRAPPPPCAPCERRTCNQARHFCMEDLSVEAVLAELR